MIEDSLTDSKEATSHDIPSVILDESGNVLFFETDERLARYIEPIDVKNGEYVAYDGSGALLELYVSWAERRTLGGPLVRYEAVGTRPAGGRDEVGLRSALRKYLDRVGGQGRDSDSTLELVRRVASLDGVWY